MINQSQSRVTEFRAWASAELRVLSACKASARSAIEESRRFLASISTGEQRRETTIPQPRTVASADSSGPVTEQDDAGARTLSQYRAQFLTHGGKIFRVESLRAEDDDAAITRAKQEFRSGIGMGYEIWNGDRHVHTELY